MIRVTLHLSGGTPLTFDCPASGPLYEQIASLATGLGSAPSENSHQKNSVVELEIMSETASRSIALAIGDVLAVETKPAHSFVTAPTTARPAVAKPSKIPERTPRGPKVKLTIGMATYDDYDGVYFSLQALRLYHPEIMDDVEFLIIDDNPDGPCAEALKKLETHVPNYRYIPHAEKSSTTVREMVFTESNGTYVVCMDCHVFVVPGALKKLIGYFDAHPDTPDLVQGPLLSDNLKGLSTHFKPEWRAGMYGHWDLDQAGKDVDAPPFDIPMQGLGLFACRREAWQGFSEKFSGFGGEEGYIHEKFRQAGARTLCLPFLRWMHRFNRPMGVPYVNSWEDRIRNYFIGFSELGLDIEPIKEHFRELLGQEVANKILDDLRTELDLGT